jgi:hypothetical protein
MKHLSIYTRLWSKSIKGANKTENMQQSVAKEVFIAAPLPCGIFVAEIKRNDDGGQDEQIMVAEFVH